MGELARARGIVRCLLVGAAATGCEPETVERAFSEGASMRRHVVITRGDHAAARASAVLFVLHPYATEPAVLLEALSLERHAVIRRGFLIVVPEGARDARGDRAWHATAACCGAGPGRPDDLAYLRGILAAVKRDYAVDAARVYALGVSNGAFMAQRWACSGSDLSGIITVSGVGPGIADAPCTPGASVRVLHVHGELDQVILYGGGTRAGAKYPSVTDTLGRWARSNHCDQEVTTERRWSPLHGWMRRSAWSRCTAPVVLWTLEEGEHHLPSLRFSISEMLNFLEPP